MRREANKRRLSIILVRRLRPKPRAYLVWDTVQRGLAIKIEPTGYRAWKCVYRHHNRPRWFHIAPADAIGLADARKLASQIMLDAIKGMDPAAEKRAARGAGTFAELAERHREEFAKKRNKSWRQADRLVRKFLLPRWGRLSAKAIARADVRTLMGSITGPVLANQVLAAASAIFSWAVKQEIVAVNPCTGIERNKTQSRERTLSDAEVPQFWKAFDDCGLLRASALRMILLTGQRPGEIAHMRREHLQDGWWEMPGKPQPERGWPGTKNGAGHRVWLPQAAQAIIAELSDATGFVFEGGRGAITDLDGAMRSVCRRLGVERATPHDLRRSHGTMITRSGFGREAMNRIQNHKEGGIASVYDRHGYAEESKRIMETVAAHIMALAQGKAAQANVLPFTGKV